MPSHHLSERAVFSSAFSVIEIASKTSPEASSEIR